MSQYELNKLKQRLLVEESYLLNEIQGQIAELGEAIEAAGEERISAADDASAEIFEHEKTMAVEGAFEEMLAEVRHALFKMGARTYGVCDNCGQLIDPQRLEARPQAALCVACKNKEEHAQLGHQHALAGSR